MSKVPSRIYICNIGDETRLVRAQNRVQALSHVARSKIAVRIAGQDDLVSALSRGTQVEAAREDLETEDLDFTGETSTKTTTA